MEERDANSRIYGMTKIVTQRLGYERTRTQGGWGCVKTKLEGLWTPFGNGLLRFHCARYSMRFELVVVTSQASQVMAHFLVRPLCSPQNLNPSPFETTLIFALGRPKVHIIRTLVSLRSFVTFSLHPYCA